MPETGVSDITQWGMVIDLDKCTGCSNCVTACYAENNVPVVGYDQCVKGRQQAWIHVGRYWKGDYPEVTAEYAPMLCQQCGNAPCESVCPVFASSHSEDGLNQQVYNRCIGTRFCANNCPYHVRVFNWYDPYWPSPLEQQLNPDCTVRGAGVMEKCTFCVQRIRRSNQDATVRHNALVDGELRPACAQACPPQAIWFGKLNDQRSAVSQLWTDNEARYYRVLQDKNTEPHVIYLKKIKEKADDVL
jgi:molybdopterin-containing oxidoreductase family iron-sulfur binding subunit